MAEAGAVESASASGWLAELELGFALRRDRTALVHRRHSGPLLVQRPFHPEGEVCHVYLIHPPGGVVGGDRLDIRIAAAPGSHALVTTPAAGKFYRSAVREARQTVDIELNRACFEWLPQETIFYRDAHVRTLTRVRVDDASRFIAWEVGCYGLTARDEPFSSGRVLQGFEIWNGQQPLLHDHLRLDGADDMMKARWGLAGLPVLGTLLAYPMKKEDVAVLRELDALNSDGALIGLTLVDGVLVCRCVAAHADAVKRRFVALWQQLRPRLMGRAASAPRIWAT